MAKFINSGNLILIEKGKKWEFNLLKSNLQTCKLTFYSSYLGLPKAILNFRFLYQSLIWYPKFSKLLSQNTLEIPNDRVVRWYKTFIIRISRDYAKGPDLLFVFEPRPEISYSVVHISVMLSVIIIPRSRDLSSRGSYSLIQFR